MALDETERYRQAAEEALEQLDWCIGYLHGIRKPKISAHLARNRAHIKRNLMREATAPVPTEVTTET
jgi:O-phosphoseryl-tRNA(Cys) synthetase